MSGKLVVFEGIDGSGKSTQFRMICNRLTSEKVPFKRVIFPRYNEPSSALIKMYLGGEFGTDPDAVNAYAASSFFAVDRFASFISDWREYYEKGGLILTDRYTTSNAIHQGAKMSPEQRKSFFSWLFDYEFNLIGLPKPDLIFYMNIDVPLAAKRMSARQAETETDADIHEQDTDYLEKCAQCGAQAAAEYDWYIVNCVKDAKERTQDDLHNEIYARLRCLMNTEN